MTHEQAAIVFSIRDTNARIRAVIEKETVGKPFWISGLARKLYNSEFGHLYFELFDVEEQYAISCMLRQNVRNTMGFSLANGQTIEAFGTVRVFEQRAKIEFEVDEIHVIESTLPRLNEDAEAFLTKKGLWPRTKQPLPETISKIWIISSKNSDAIRDFETYYREHGGQAEFGHKYVRIQGVQAAQEIADAINAINRDYNGDLTNVIVLTRGGGRDVDLQVFSDPIIGEAICRSILPVVTGIGHEGNETFADIAANVSKGTPTAIAVFLADHDQVKRVEKLSLSFEQHKVISTLPDAPDSKTQWVGWVVLFLFVMVVLVVIMLVFR